MLSSLLSKGLVSFCPTVRSFTALAVRSVSSTSFLADQTSRKIMREPPSDSLLSFSAQFYRHPSAPVVVGWVDLEASQQSEQRQQLDNNLPNESQSAPLQAMNRNARMPKRANRGKRAVCRQARRAKKRAIGNHRR